MISDMKIIRGRHLFRARFIFLLCFLLISVSFPLSADLNFRSVEAINSLSQSSVLCMVQDSTGFLWIGTKDGLNRFDGYEFVTYKYDSDDPNTLSNNEISCLALQSDSLLWIGTRSGGINRLDLTTGRISRFNMLTYDDLIRDLYIDSEGELWAGTSEGLFRFSVEKDRFENVSRSMIYRRENNEPFNPIRKNLSIVSIFQHEPGKLLLGAEQGLFEFEVKDGDDFRSISSITEEQTVFTKILRDKRGQLWASSYDGLNYIKKRFNDKGYDVELYNDASPHPYKLPVDWVEDFVEDRKGNMWLATRGGGLALMVNNKIEEVYSFSNMENSGIPDNIINSLYIDRTGVLWIGTESKELVFLDLYAKKFRTILSEKHNGVSDNLVTAITGNNNVLFAGTSTSGIDVFDISDKSVGKIANIPRVVLASGQWKSEISALLLDSDSMLWVGSATNSLAVHKGGGSFDSYVVNGFVFTLLEDNRDNIWFGTWGQGIGYINKYTRVVEQYNETPSHMLGLGSDKVLTLFRDSRDLLWVGTKGGGLSVAPIEEVISRRGNFKVFRHNKDVDNSLAYNDVFAIEEDHKGNIWLATGVGLNMLNAGELSVKQIMAGEVKFTHIGEEDGLPGGLVYSIREDTNNHLWLGTNKGLCRYVPEQAMLVSYGVNDGLASPSFTVNSVFEVPSTGDMYFGGVNGVTFFHPDSIVSNPFQASVTITDLRLHNRSVLPFQKVNGRQILDRHIYHTDKLQLAYADNEVSFEFSALHFSSPDKIRYSYRLLGFNDEWQETGSQNRRITYTNLRSGDYCLQIIATNNDGLWAPGVSELQITISPPIWLSIWAYIFYAAVFLFLLIVFRKYSLIAVKEKNQLIIESMEHKKETEIAEAKMRFFTNVSHEIRTPLTLIHAPIQQLIEKGELDENTHNVLVMVFRNVKRLLNQVNQLLELRKMDKGQFSVHVSNFSLESMLQDTLLDFEPALRQEKIEVVFNSDENTIIHSDRRMIDTVFHNLISNSVKYSSPGSSISIAISRVEDKSQTPFILVKICDEGPGIPEDEIKNVFNRFYQINKEGFEHTGGSGIGLSIVKEFVERLGGSIEVANLDGGGCCFKISLPIGEEASAVLPNEAETADDDLFVELTSDEVEADKNINARILMIIEDDADLASYLKSVFEKRFKTFVFNNGRKAFEEVQSIMPDLIICDIMLPGMNGIEFTKSIKFRKETSHIPVVLLTARSGEDNMVEGLNVGADSYITKPFSINILEAQVGSLMKSREAFRARFSKQMVLEPTEEAITPMDEKFLTKLIEITDRKLSDPAFDVSYLVEEMHMSHSIILKKVKALTGLSLVEFIRSMRIKKAVQIFKQDKLSVSEVGFMVGFSDPKYFSKCFTKEMGVKPTEYIKEQHG